MSEKNHVVSLETAKRIHELGGLNVKPVFMYWTHPDIPGEHYELVYTGEEGFSCNEFCVPTYLATEILEELPKCIYYNKHGFLLEACATVESVNEFYCDYTNSDNMNHPDTYTHYHANLAEALALLWCELKEKGII